MNVIEFANIIKELHGTSYFVGGCVRDEIMKRIPHDYDLMICGVKESDFNKRFPNATYMGNSFPVYRMEFDGEEMEVAFARKERKTGFGYTGFKIFFDPSITLQDDLIRRDTTINAMAKNVLTGEIVDLFNGMEDIKRKVIRHVSYHFSEDPVRALRVARQATQFGFSVDSSTMEQMKLCKEELAKESNERFVTELIKALSTDKPSTFFRILKEADLLDVTFPFVFNLIGKEQSKKWHPEGDAFEHTMLILDKVSQVNNDVCVRFSALTHDIGKGALEAPYRGHDVVGVDLIESLPQTYLNKWKTMAKFTSNYHMRVINMKNLGKIVDMLTEMKHKNIDREGFRQIVNADSNNVAWFLEEPIFKLVNSVNISIPSHMKKTSDIKAFVRNLKIKALQNKVLEMKI